MNQQKIGLYHKLLAAGAGVVLVLTMLPQRVSAANPAAGWLSLEIQLAKHHYLYREEIPVEAVLTNVGNDELRVLEPLGLAFAATFEIYRVDPGPETYVPVQVLGMGGPGWVAFPLTLAPSTSARSSTDLLMYYDRALTPGKYKIRGVYHLEDYFSPDFNNEAFLVYSPYITFEVIQPSGTDLEALDLLDKGYASELIERFPSCRYVVEARRVLRGFYWERGDLEGRINQMELILQCDPTETQRNLTLWNLSLAYRQKGDIELAIERARACGLRQVRMLAERWESQLTAKSSEEAPSKEGPPQ